MPWSYSTDAQTFLHQRKETLSADESLYCLTWAAITRSMADEPGTVSHRFLTFLDGYTITAHAIIQAHGRHLILSPMSSSQAQSLADTLAADGVQINITEGPKDPTLCFVRRWRLTTGSEHKLIMDQGLHELKVVNMPVLSGGRLVQATPEHRAVLLELMHGFASSISEDTVNLEGLERRADRALNRGHTYLWQDRDNIFVSMAAIVRESPSTASISWVYTPPKYRRNGHAARVVATLSQAQLDAGKRACNLHTDLANPTSNNVYKRIGYLKIAESFRIQFKSAHQGTGPTQ